MQKLPEGYSWDLDGFDPYRFQQADGDVIPITYLAADHIFRLIPEPGEKLPQAEYIQKAQETHDLKYIMFFLHHYENYFNYWIGSFTAQDYFWTAEHFLDMKLACRETVLEVFPRYDPSRGILFTTFVKPFIWDALRLCRLCYDTWSVESLADIKKIRKAAALFNRFGNVYQAEEEFARQEQCSNRLAQKYVAWAKMFWNRRLPIILDVDDDGWERDEELFQDHWNYVDMLWSGTQARDVDLAFEQLSYREQTLIESRNAICVNCGRVRPLGERLQFDELAAKFEISSASGAERAYKRAIEKLMLLLVKRGALHCVRVRQVSLTKSKGKRAAVYEYQVDESGAWGRIEADLEANTFEVTEFAENDPANTWAVTDVAIDYIREQGCRKQGKEVLLPAEKGIDD